MNEHDEKFASPASDTQNVTVYGRRLGPINFDVIVREYPWMKGLVESHVARSGSDARPYGAKERVQGIEGRTIIAKVAEQIRKDRIALNKRNIKKLKGKPTPEEIRQCHIHMEMFYKCLFDYVSGGRKTFLFEDALADRLADTELNVDSSLFALPFGICAFVYDNQAARDALCAIVGFVPPTWGIVTASISECERMENGDRKVLVTSSLTQDYETVLYMNRLLLVPATGTVEDAARTNWGNETNTANSGFNFIPDSTYSTVGFIYFRMILNSALYLTSSEPELSDVVESRARTDIRSVDRRLDGGSAPQTSFSYIKVGSSIGPRESLLGHGQGRKLEHRLKVRAHWKTQRYGKLGENRKTILVQEYWKGPDAAEVLSRPYIVTTPNPTQIEG